MPTSIPYDHPSLVLGSVVDPQILNNMDQIATLNQGVDAAQEKLNSLIMMKRSFSMTLNELSDMNVQVSDLEDEIKAIEPEITQAASAYLKTRLDSEKQIQQIKVNLSKFKVTQSDSPVDFGSSSLKGTTISL